MKTIVIKIVGDGEWFFADRFTDPQNYNNIPSDKDYWELVEEGLVEGEHYELPIILENLKVLLYEDYESAETDYDNELGLDLTKMKGKYIKTKTYFEDNGFKSPFMYGRNGFEQFEFIYEIELEDGEVFDPKKLQLIKTDYELEFYPYAITTKIKYGERFYTYLNAEIHDNVDYYLDEVYDGDQPYA